MKMDALWLFPILCLPSLILCENSGSVVAEPQLPHDEPLWHPDSPKSPLTKIITKLLPSKLPELEQSNKIKKYDAYLKAKKARELKNRFLLEDGIIIKNGTATIDKNFLRDRKEELEESNRIEKIANRDLVEGLNMMVKKNLNLDQVIDDVLLSDKNVDVYSG